MQPCRHACFPCWMMIQGWFQRCEPSSFKARQGISANHPLSRTYWSGPPWSNAVICRTLKPFDQPFNQHPSKFSLLCCRNAWFHRCLLVALNFWATLNQRSFAATCATGSWFEEILERFANLSYLSKVHILSKST